MKKLFLLPFILLCLFKGLQAQIGISAGWVKNDAPEWNKGIIAINNLVDKAPAFEQNGLQIGVDYWFRLKNKRLEFLPELSFYQLRAVLESEVIPDYSFAGDLKANIFQVHFNTQIYPFDFAGDCDCPTFSKEGDLFKKGLFIRLAPGLSFANFNEERTDVTIAGSNTISTNSGGIAPTLRGGIGLDIGVSDFFTITPIIQYTYTFDIGGFEFFNISGSDDLLLSEITQLYFGIRLGFRFDELNKYGYR